MKQDHYKSCTMVEGGVHFTCLDCRAEFDPRDIARSYDLG